MMDGAEQLKNNKTVQRNKDEGGEVVGLVAPPEGLLSTAVSRWASYLL